MSVAETNLKDSREQLSLVLSFFPRVDSKLSAVLGIDIAMLASMSASVPPMPKVALWMLSPPAIAAILLAASFAFLYSGGFPDVKGGGGSITYFKEIARRTEAKFVEEYCGHTLESLRADLLGQAWRNSEILANKYHSLKMAFIFMAAAVVPWAVSLAIFALARSNGDVTVIRH